MTPVLRLVRFAVVFLDRGVEFAGLVSPDDNIAIKIGCELNAQQTADGLSGRLRQKCQFNSLPFFNVPWVVMDLERLYGGLGFITGKSGTDQEPGKRFPAADAQGIPIRRVGNDFGSRQLA